MAMDESPNGRDPQELLGARAADDVDVVEERAGGLDRTVFGVTGAIAVAFVVWGFADTDGLSSVSGDALSWVMVNTGWAFVLLASLFVIFAIWLAMSRYGRIPLGADDEKPEFRTISWIAMMFSAGMGIGLMFYGVAEPLSHFVAPPPGTAEAETDQALQVAMATTLFHWTLHPWAIYAVVGLAIAYGTFRRGRSQLISSAFRPLLGNRVDGVAGRIIDILAIFATLFGSAASLGLGTMQIGQGIEFNGWLDTVGEPLLVTIIAVLTVCFVASAVSGVAKGIQWLSNINMVLAIALALFVFLVGPTTNTNSASASARTMLMLDSHWIPLATPDTAEATNAIVSTAMIATRRVVPTVFRKPPAISPPPICSAPRPSEAAEPNSVAKIARMSIARPNTPSVPRAPSSGLKAELMSWRRPRRNVP